MHHVWKSNGDYELHISKENRYVSELQFPMDECLAESYEPLEVDDYSRYGSLKSTSTDLWILTIKAAKLPPHSKDAHRVTRDDSVNCAYIYLSGEHIHRQSLRINDHLVLDLDKDDRVAGIEIVGN